MARAPTLVLLAQLGGCGASEVPSPADGPSELACGPADHVPRQLRLLTRHEYDRTVGDLLPMTAVQQACAVDVDCAVELESCVAGTCTPDPCELVTFVYAAAPGSTVVVAGAFNGWSSDPVAGGWGATYEPAIGAYVTKRAVADGTWPYKFVVDGAWLPDPANPATADDGYGGVNSVLVQACAGAPEPVEAVTSPSATFPVESRPTGYPFDNAAETGLVTAVHAEQYADAAAGLAEVAFADPVGVLGCDAEAAGCVEGWLASFGRRVFRRPLDAAELARYEALVASAPDRTSGAEAALRAFLQSPYFLYRVEAGAPASPGVVRLDDYEIAANLAYFLWGTTPDDALLDAAAAHRLADADGRAAEARRMLADPRARDTFARLVTQWLGVDTIPAATRSAALYPAFDAALAQTMLRETEVFAGWVAFEAVDGGTFGDLLLSDTLFVDADLAAVYGVTPPATFGPVPAPAERRGLLGQAAFLTATSHSDQSSPVARGVRIHERVLCHTFGTPPAAAGGVPDVDPDATTRERFEQHSADPACASCHSVIDPTGFGLEGFDAIGAFRTTENGRPIDTSGSLAVDGRAPTAFDGQVALAELLATSDEARACFTTQVLRQATGRLDVPACAVDPVDAAFAASGGILTELLVAVASSPERTWRSE